MGRGSERLGAGEERLREEMLRRLIPIALEELGVDDERVRELVGNKSDKREFYF